MEVDDLPWVCSNCGEQCTDDDSEVFETYTVHGVEYSRTCWKCDPPDSLDEDTYYEGKDQ